MGQEMLEIFLAFLKAFAVGGGICLIAQIIINFTDLTAGKILVYFMLAGVVLTAVVVFDYFINNFPAVNVVFGNIITLLPR